MRTTPLALAMVLIGCGPATGKVDTTSETTTDPPGTTTGGTTGLTTGLTTGSPGTETDNAKDWWVNGTIEVPTDAEIPSGDVIVVAVAYYGVVGTTETTTTYTGDSINFTYSDIYRRVNIGPISAGDSAPFALGMPDVPEDQYFEMDPYSNAELASFVIGAFVDENGDGEAGPGDSFVGAGIHHLSYVKGQVSTNLSYYGIDLGWNSIWYNDIDAGDVTIETFSGDLSPYPIDANLLPVPPVGALGCTVRPPLQASPLGAPRVDIFSINEFMAYYGEVPYPADSSLMTQPLLTDTPNQNVQFDASTPTPPQDHFTDDLGDGLIAGLEIAWYLGIAYIDADASGDFDFAVDYWVTDSSPDNVTPDDARDLMYVRATGWQAAWYDQWLGGMGWVVYAQDNDAYDAPPILIPWTDGIIVGAP